MKHELPPIAATALLEFAETLKRHGYLETFAGIVRSACVRAPTGKEGSLCRTTLALYTKAVVAEQLRVAVKLPEDLDATRVMVVLDNAQIEKALRAMIKVFAMTCGGMVEPCKRFDGWDSSFFEQFIKACGATMGELAAEEVVKVLTELRWVKP